MYIIILSFLFQVLIQSQQPSYELRHNQFESIFLSAITYGSQFSPEVLQVRYKYCCLWHKYPVTQYSVTQYPVTQYSVTQYPVTQLCDAVPGDTSTRWRTILWHSTRWHSTLWRSTRWHKYLVTQNSVTQYPVTHYPVTQYPVTQYPVTQYPVTLPDDTPAYVMLLPILSRFLIGLGHLTQTKTITL